jgi:hypothetical protein
MKAETYGIAALTSTVTSPLPEVVLNLAETSHKLSCNCQVPVVEGLVSDAQQNSRLTSVLFASKFVFFVCVLSLHPRRDAEADFRNFLVDAFAIFIFVVWFWLLITVYMDLTSQAGPRRSG